MKNYKEGENIKICGVRYYVHIGNDDEMRLEKLDDC